MPSPSHWRAVLQALFVTVLWSTSWVLIKFGLADIPALTFAGLRYVLAAMCLLPFALRGERLAALRALTGRDWAALVSLGLLLYAATQGAQFLGLAYLPAATVSLMLNLTSVVVVALGIAVLREWPTGWQWAGVLINLTGVGVYFYPVSVSADQGLGLGIMTAGVLANGLSAVLGREVNRGQRLDPLTVTAVSMTIGSVVLLATGVAVQGLPPLDARHWALIGWLAVVNSAVAFTLWNRTLRTLSAMESNLINSTMLIQIAILAWVFLGEALTAAEIAGLVLAGIGVILVQARR
jgi:drug/metabolite transporter (DMT)-like permease